MFGNFEWGGVEIDFDKVPEKVQAFLMQKGFIHKAGNEVAAAIVKQRTDFKPTEDAPEFDEDAASLELRKKLVDRLLDGTIATRIAGPRGNTIENIAWELAMKQAEATLAPKGLWPKADRKNGVKAEDATIEFAGKAMTRDELTDVVFEKYKDKLLEDAKEEHAKRAEKAKLAKQNAVKAVGKVDQSIDALI